MAHNIVIGIAGGTASGKTTIAQAIENAFHKEEVLIIRQDNYYQSQDHLTAEERKLVDFDHPNAFDFDLLYAHIEKLRNGDSVEQPIYDFTTHTRSTKKVIASPARVIVLEGILVFEDPRLIKLMDVKVFIDTEADLRFIRRLLRDTAERGRTIEQSIEQYLRTARPGHERFVEPAKKKADIIIPYKDHNTVAIEMLIDKIRYIISQNK